MRDYLSFLALRKRVSSSTQNQAFNALLFLFRDVLKIALDSIGDSVRAKRGPKLPVVLTPNEVKEIFKHVSGKDKLMLQLLYGTGVRIAELACLRVKDIDFKSGLIFIRSGKGDKDRSTVLPEYLKADLRVHLKEVQKLFLTKKKNFAYQTSFMPACIHLPGCKTPEVSLYSVLVKLSILKKGSKI